MTEVTIRRAGAGDWESVAALHAASWRSAYRGIYSDDFLDHDVTEHRRAYWCKHLPAMDGDLDAVFLAEEVGRSIGFACLRRRADPAGPLLDNLHILPDRKGSGIGRRLMRAAAAWLVAHEPDASLQLQVWAANEDARGFYRRVGGEEVEALEEAVPGGALAPIIRVRWARAADLAETVA